MKYIPGFTFTPNIKIKGGSLLEQQAKRKKILRNSIFKEGVNYQIHHIIPQENQVKYFFLVDGKLEEMTFNNIKEAELKISKVLGE